MRTTCPYCKLPIATALQDVEFTSGSSSGKAITLRVAVEWCDRIDCYKSVELYNHHDRRKGEFVDRMLRVRDSLRPISDGEIERGCRVSQYDQVPGKRKTKLKDAKEICAKAIERMNIAINEWTEHIF